MPADLQPRTWRVTTIQVPPPDGGPPKSVVRTITAAYSASERTRPGWTRFKDARHKVVYEIRDEMILDIERVDDPTTTT